MALNGIDISNWQAGINLSVVPSDFVVMKATQGTGYVSPDFKRQYASAKDAGRLLGVYHYASGGGAEAEAKFFLSKVKDCIGEAILVLDWEGSQNPNFGVCDASWCKTWLDYVCAKTGVKPVLYISSGLRNKFRTVLDSYPLWAAQYPSYNQVNGYLETPWNEGAYPCLIRQYTSRGRLNGWNGNLDLNKLYGDASDWKTLAGIKEQESDDPVTEPTSVHRLAAKEPSSLDLVVATMLGEFGDGKNRKEKLGNRWEEVQKIINHVYYTDAATLAKEVINGDYGNGDTRRAVLGERWNEVMAIVNKQM